MTDNANPNNTVASIRIDPDLVDRWLRDLASHGAYGETGVWRTVYSPEWIAAANRVMGWAQQAGLAVRQDAVGNIWGRLEGSEGGKAIVTGSHLDSQRPGGWFDGGLGVVGGLAAIRALHEQFGAPRRPVEFLVFCEEEGSRFPTAGFWGSRAITGDIPSDGADTTISYDGEIMSDVMRSIGLAPDAIDSARRDDIEAFVELHIEQGPILEQARLAVAAVDGITGMRHYAVELTGVANHAGAFPMDLRRDPMAGAAEIISGVINTAHRMGRPAVTTVGRISADPNGAAIVPERVSFVVDARHPDPEARQLLYRRHEALMREVAERRGLEISWTLTQDPAPVRCDPEIVAMIEDVAKARGLETLTMASGAGHDTQRMAKVARVAMIFIRSRDGRSHTPDEFSSLDDCVAGIGVLAGTLHRLAW
ncbi:MAG TPA: hydantoinase/carbamoylase family amidase [Thermomicrobiales bacterium]|nr:hydantoinase/carbamoylase family amidase [Thermomicrobiales bacterium]